MWTPGWKYQLVVSCPAIFSAPGRRRASAWDSSWGGHCLALLRLAAKLFHVGADVDGLACHLHQPTNYGWQTRIQSLLRGAIPSHRTAYAGAILDSISRGVRSPGDDPSDVVLIVWVLDGPHPLWRSLLLLRRAYLMSKLSWRLCVFLWWSCYVK
jgi:hypothetical protein